MIFNGHNIVGGRLYISDSKRKPEGIGCINGFRLKQSKEERLCTIILYRYNNINNNVIVVYTLV